MLVRVPEAAGLAAASERLRRAIADLGIEHASNRPHGVVTASLGAVLVTSADLATSDDDWFGRADAALYRAKAEGRNRVEIAA